jgi:hypothetical protein
MKGTLTFNLDSSEDGHEEQRTMSLCLKARDMHAMIRELLDTVIRDKLSHGKLGDEAVHELENLREWVLDEIEDRGIPWV